MQKASNLAGRVYEVDDHLKILLNMAAGGSVTYSAFGSTFTLPTERKFGDIESVQRYINGLVALGPVIEEWPERAREPIRVHARRGRNQVASYDDGRISIPDHGGGISSMMRELTVLHELAHHFGGGGHGVEYRAAYVRLVEIALGSEVAFLMRMYHSVGLE